MYGDKGCLYPVTQNLMPIPMRLLSQTSCVVLSEGADKTCEKPMDWGCVGSAGVVEVSEDHWTFCAFGREPVNKRLRHSEKRNIWHAGTKQAGARRNPFHLVMLRAFLASHANYTPAIFISDPRKRRASDCLPSRFCCHVLVQDSVDFANFPLTFL